MSTTAAPTPEGAPVLAGLQAAVVGFVDEWRARADPLCTGSGSFEVGGPAALPDLTAQLESMSDEALLAVADHAAAVQQALDAQRVAIAGAIEARSRAERGEGSLAKSQGYASAPLLVADRWRIGVGQARVLCEVGAAVATRRTFFGQPLPPEFPGLAAAIVPVGVAVCGVAADADAAGDAADAAPGPGLDDATAPAHAPLTVDGAAAVLRELRKAAPAIDADQLALGERICVEHASWAPLNEVKGIAIQVRDRLDQDGAMPREALQKQRRSCIMTTDRHGMLDVRLLLDPEGAAWFRSGVDAIVGRDLRTPRFVDLGYSDGEATVGAGSPSTGQIGAHPSDLTPPDADIIPDPRTMEQRRADAVVDVFRHAAQCDGAALNLAPVSVVVRMDLESLTNGTGLASIDGIAEPITAGTARRLAADAKIIPMVLGGASQPLDLGYERRLFSRAQKIALAERDGGCAWTGCVHPPSYTEAHHLRPWSKGGRTDLTNGILLCTHHHHRVHADGWEIRVTDNVPWFIPPPHVDRARRPRRGGRVRLSPAA